MTSKVSPNMVEGFESAVPTSAGVALLNASTAHSQRNLLDPLVIFGLSESAVAADNSTAITAMLAAITSGLIDGQYKIFPVTTLPDITRFTRIGFKVGSVIHTSSDYFKGLRTGKVTNGMLYTAWAQDKCYMVGKQIRVWCIEKESHADGTGRIVLYVSDDNGASFQPGEYLDLAASGQTLWSAGFDPTTGNEYLFVRVPSGSTDVPPYTYTMWKRTLTLGPGTGNYYAAWTKTPITFPVPAGATGQPVMVHSFTVGHADSLVVGASYGEGAWVMRSTDGGVNWTSYPIAITADREEPTVVYDGVTQRYYGFTRHGGLGNPQFWHSAVNDLSAISLYTAPTGTFGEQPMGDSPTPLKIFNGRIYAFSSYRTGTLEGNADDELTSAFYMDFPVVAGNIWAQATTKIFRIGTIPHREGAGAASACGQASIVMVGSRVHIYFGMEERTGTTADRNRIANIYQLAIPTVNHSGAFDFRDEIPDNLAYLGPMRKIAENRGWVIYTDDASDNVPARIGGRPNFAPCKTVVEIDASGIATLPGAWGRYFIDTNAASAADDLTRILTTGHTIGDVICLRQASSARDVTVKHNTGADTDGMIYLNGQTDKLLSQVKDNIYLMLDLIGTVAVWFQVSFNDNSAA